MLSCSRTTSDRYLLLPSKFAVLHPLDFKENEKKIKETRNVIRCRRKLGKAYLKKIKIKKHKT